MVVLLLCEGYVLVMHKLSQKAAGLFSIFVYFVQTALLIAAPALSTATLEWLSVFDMQPQDSAGLCVGPITAVGMVQLSLSMPFAFMALLGLNVLAHFLAGRIGPTRSHLDHTSGSA